MSANTTRTAKKELGDILVEKRVISPEQLLQALDILSRETTEKRRRLPQVLVDDLKINHDKVYREIADYYAFRTLSVVQETIDDDGLVFIRAEMNALPIPIRTMAFENRVMPLREDADRPGRLLVITPDPTRRERSEER